MKNTMVSYRTIDQKDIDLISLCDSPEEAVELIIEEMTALYRRLEKEEPFNPMFERLRTILSGAGVLS